MTNQAVILIVMAGYMLMIIAIGILFARRSNKNAESYFLGGRTLGPWVSAMSAEASDMSGYLLMGVPGLAYWCGLADAGWTAIGLALGTYLNWLLVSRRLRSYSVAAGNAITVPDFLSNRFHEKEGHSGRIGHIYPDLLYRVRRQLLCYLRQALCRAV